MFFNRKKRKASTLLEVIISLAITALLIVPAMNMILTSVKNVQKTKEKEKAEFIGKQIAEELKAIDLSLMGSEENLTSGINLYKDVNGNISTNGNQLIDNKYEVKVDLNKSSDIDYVNASSDLDGEFDIYLEADKLVIKDIKTLITKQIKIKTDNINNEEKISEKILIVNNHLTNDIKIKTESGEEITINKTKETEINDNVTEKTGYLKINLLENNDTDITIKFDVKNLMDKDFNIYISTREGSKFKSDVNIEKASIGSILITKDNFTPKPIGSMYDFKVEVRKKDGEILFTLNGYKNINL